MDFLEIGKQIANELEKMGAKKIELLDVSKKTNQTKFLIFCNMADETLNKATSLQIQEFVKNLGLELLRVDGFIKGEWIIHDFAEVIVHIFTENSRTKYNLEKLWKDSKNSVKFK
ncbi:MAG: ribosome silencing factor [Clostridia bacterium]|nr:ribosome silencing factor [Clostridia bacterium]